MQLVRRGLADQADPERAVKAQAYMKSAMPFRGVPVPQVRKMVRSLAKQRPITSREALRDTVLTLWHDAKFREERYAATELTALTSVRKLRDPEQLALYRELITTGAWWDHVDEVSHRVGDLLLDFSAQIRPVLETWRVDPDLWLRRSSIICQVGAKDRTDRELLTDAIESNTQDKDFFIRKAIGWALRDFARTDPDWVRRFVVTHDLSPLSVREATKHL